jgi:hypothetical protein
MRTSMEAWAKAIAPFVPLLQKNDDGFLVLLRDRHMYLSILLGLLCNKQGTDMQASVHAD